jgi:hypothetical protein
MSVSASLWARTGRGLFAAACLAAARASGRSSRWVDALRLP